jgi:hypothetical protein
MNVLKSKEFDSTALRNSLFSIEADGVTKNELKRLCNIYSNFDIFESKKECCSIKEKISIKNFINKI